MSIEKGRSYLFQEAIGSGAFRGVEVIATGRFTEPRWFSGSQYEVHKPLDAKVFWVYETQLKKILEKE